MWTGVDTVRKRSGHLDVYRNMSIPKVNSIRRSDGENVLNWLEKKTNDVM